VFSGLANGDWESVIQITRDRAVKRHRDRNLHRSSSCSEVS